MSDSSPRRLACTIGLVWALALSGCLLSDPTTNAPAAPDDRIRLRPVPGLDRVDVPIPGVLELLPTHRIGGYDALLIRVSSIDPCR